MTPVRHSGQIFGPTLPRVRRRSWVDRTAPVVILATLLAALQYSVRQWDELFNVGPFTLHIEDAIVALTITYCCAWGLKRWRSSPLEYLNLLLAAIVVVNLARGIEAAGIKPAADYFRGMHAGFIAASVFVFLMYRRIDLDWVLDKVVLLGWGFVLVSAARLVFGLNAFLAPAFLALNPELYGLNRTLNSEAAFMLGGAALIVLSRLGALPPGPGRRRMRLTFVVFVAAILISDQRTASVAALAGAAAVLAAWPRRRRALVLAAGSFVLVAAAIVFGGTWIAAQGDITSLLPHDVAKLNTEWSFENPTFVWRLLQWQDYIDFYANAGPLDQVIGLPLGVVQTAGLREHVGMLQTSAHSGYVTTLLDSGAFGVVLFVWMLAAGITRGIKLLRRTPSGNSSASMIGLAIGILVSDAVFSVAYVVSNEQGLLLAIALQIIATAPRSARQVVRPQWMPAGPMLEGRGSGVDGDDGLLNINLP